MQAVILAAGYGSRIRDYHDLPKGFICVGEQPIIVESIHKLKQAGINEILLVTGYRSECYESLAKTDPSVTTIFNPEHMNSGSLYSLYCAKDWVKEDFLLLESDLLYDKRALSIISNDSNPNCILLSAATQSDDEIYVQANGTQLIDMSKQKASLDNAKIYGEFVGINKLSYAAYQQLISLLDEDSALLSSGHYEEDGLIALTKFISIHCLKVPDLLWCEIDNTAHLERALKLYPRLEKEAKEAEYAS